MPTGGGATFLSNGGILIPTAMDYVNYLYDICAGFTDRDLLETFVEKAMKIEDYIRDIGGEFERWVSQEVGISFPPLARPSWPKVPSGKSMVRGHIKAYDVSPPKENPSIAERVRAVGRAYGPDLWRLLTENVERRGIPVMTSTLGQRFGQERGRRGGWRGCRKAGRESPCQGEKGSGLDNRWFRGE